MALYSSLAPSHLISSIRENTHTRMHHTKIPCQALTRFIMFLHTHAHSPTCTHTVGAGKKEIGCTYLVPRGPKSGTSIPQSCYSLREAERHTQWEGERVSVYVLFQEVYKKIYPLPSKAKSSFLVLYRFDHFEGMQEKNSWCKKYSWILSQEKRLFYGLGFNLRLYSAASAVPINDRKGQWRYKLDYTVQQFTFEHWHKKPWAGT